MFILVFAAFAGYSQEHRISLSSGTLKFSEVNKLTIEGTTGNEVIFTSKGVSTIPDRAKGLRPVNSLGLQDNTGVGLSVTQEDNSTYVVSDVMRNSGEYLVKVPKGVRVMIEQNSVHGSRIELRDLPNDVEVSSRYSEVVLKNISGSALVNSVHGGVIAEFSTITPDKPVSIVSAHGHVDVTLPASAKLDVVLSSKYGDIFTDMDIQYATTSDQMRQITSEIKGKLNGGGTEMFLEAKHSNIYLRKK